MRYLLLLLCCVLTEYCSAGKINPEQPAHLHLSLANAVPGEPFRLKDVTGQTHSREFRRRERLANAFIIPGAVVGFLGLLVGAQSLATSDDFLGPFIAGVGIGAGAVIATPGIIIKIKNHKRFRQGG